MNKYLTLAILITAIFFTGFSGDKKLKPDYNLKVIDKKVKELVSAMTLEEKIGQMTQVDYGAIKANLEDISKLYLGSILWGGDTEVDDISAAGWLKVAEQLHSYTLNTRLKIPLLTGIDAVHGHNNVNGAVILPHNIGIGCTRNPKLAEKAGIVTSEEVAATGLNWAFGPCIAVARDERWGRTYESFGENPELAISLGSAYIKGLQKSNDGRINVLSCAKHYVGDGGTTGGKDQGNTEVNEKTLRKIHLPGYIKAIKAGTGSIMVSYNSWNGQKLHGHKYLLTDVLKKELGFKGFLVSDWAAIDQLPGDYKKQIEASINAGLDMAMIPNGPDKKNNYREFITYLKELVNEGRVPMERINDAVTRILRVKMQMGLFNNPLPDKSFMSKFGSEEHRSIARDIVRQSLVLLKNNNKTLPLSKNLKKVFVAGKSADDIGNQCGGWTIIWQSKSGNVIDGGTTILDAIKKSVSKNTIVNFSKDGSGAEGSDVAIVVVGETPYAEMFGDKQNLSLDEEDIKTIKNAKAAGVPVVVILISGRPMIIEPILDYCDAFIAAWLPGTEGNGVTDVLFGDFKPTGKLSHSWPRSMNQIPINVGDKNYNPLFKYGFGLTY